MVRKVILELSDTINYRHYHYFLTYFWYLFYPVILNYTTTPVTDIPILPIPCTYNYSPNVVLLAHIKMHKHKGIFYTKQQQINMISEKCLIHAKMSKNQAMFSIRPPGLIKYNIFNTYQNAKAMGNVLYKISRVQHLVKYFKLIICSFHS